jgi:hypothetical protein
MPFPLHPDTHSYHVEENGFIYRMPKVYIERLHQFLQANKGRYKYPVATWYYSLKNIEKRIVEREDVIGSRNTDSGF